MSWTELHRAGKHGDVESGLAWIRANPHANINAGEKDYGNNPLYIAAAKGDRAMP
jgi:hypothetical protein